MLQRRSILPENLLVNKRREKRAEEKSYYATRAVESGTRIVLHIEEKETIVENRKKDATLSSDVEY